LLTLISLVNLNIYSQNENKLKAGVNNLLRYGNGKETSSGLSYNKEYFEDLTDVKISTKDLSAGFRFEMNKPSELGRDFKGISKRYVEFTNHDNFDIRAGSFWEIIGRGLTLNSFEQRQLAFDTGLDGIRIIFKSALNKNKSIRFKSEIIGGYLEYSDYLKPERIEKYDLKDANLELTFFSLLDFGFNYVYAKGKIPSGIYETDINAHLPEIYFSFNTSKFQLFSSYAHKRTEISANDLFPVSFTSMGDGLYSSVNYSIKNIGISLEYKNYRFDLTTPDNQSTERPTKALPFQNPPAAVKQQTTVLTSRVPHPTDFNDEVGFQLDVFYMPGEDLSISLNGSIASRHYSFYDADTSSIVRFSTNKRNLNFLPSLKNDFSPYSEISIESEYYYSDKLSGKLGFYYQHSITYNDFFKDSPDKKHYITMPIEARYNLNNKISLKLHVESQWAYNSLREAKYQNFSNYFTSFFITRSPDLAFSISGEYTTDKLELSGKNAWLEAEASWNINSSNIITIAFGSERGGLRCTSGICRYINPFNGFRLTIQNIF